MAFGVFNRAKMQYRVPSDSDTLEPIKNPHFTYHPPFSFRLKEHKARNDDALFCGIADLDLTLRQQRKMPWLRAISAPLHTLHSQRGYRDAATLEEWILEVPSECLSINMDLNFLLANKRYIDAPSRWHFAWSGVVLQASMSFTYPRAAELSWFHFH